MALAGHLSRDEGFLLLHGGSGLLCNLDVLLRGGREVRFVHRGGGRRGRGRGRGRGARGLATAEHLLGLGSVVSHKLLGHLSGVGGVCTGDALELFSLGANNILCILNVVIDQLLVGGVDQGHSKEEGGGNERKAPVWDDLDEPVRQESADGNLDG